MGCYVVRKKSVLTRVVNDLRSVFANFYVSEMTVPIFYGGTNSANQTCQQQPNLTCSVRDEYNNSDCAVAVLLSDSKFNHQDCGV